MSVDPSQESRGVLCWKQTKGLPAFLIQTGRLLFSAAIERLTGTYYIVVLYALHTVLEYFYQLMGDLLFSLIVSLRLSLFNGVEFE